MKDLSNELQDVYSILECVDVDSTHIRCAMMHVERGFGNIRTKDNMYYSMQMAATCIDNHIDFGSCTYGQRRLLCMARDKLKNHAHWSTLICRRFGQCFQHQNRVSSQQ